MVGAGSLESGGKDEGGERSCTFPWVEGEAGEFAGAFVVAWEVVEDNLVVGGGRHDEAPLGLLSLGKCSRRDEWSLQRKCGIEDYGLIYLTFVLHG